MATSGAHGDRAVRAFAGALNRCSAALLAQGGALLVELCTAITTVETISAAELFAQTAAKGVQIPEAPGWLRAASTPSAPTVLLWCLAHTVGIPIQAIGAVVKLVEIQFFLAMSVSEYGRAMAKVLFKWLMQLDLRTSEISIPSPSDAAKLEGQARQRMIEDLRTMTLLLAANAPDEAKAYLTAVAAEDDRYKVKEIRQFSRALASVAPAELAALVEASVIEPPRRGKSRRDSMGRALSFTDTDYTPPSPAQPPFLDLLDAAPDIGLALIRKLVETAVAFQADGKTTETNGHTIALDGSIGRKVAHWFDAAAAEERSLLRREHPWRTRIDAALGQLVSLGISEAHAIEMRIAAEQTSVGVDR